MTIKLFSKQSGATINRVGESRQMLHTYTEYKPKVHVKMIYSLVPFTSAVYDVLVIK